MMSKFESLLGVFLWCGLGLFACDKGGPEAQDPTPTRTADLGAMSDLPPSQVDMQPVDPYSWGEATAGTTVGPFGDFKLFRSGCGEQLWGRFIARQDFELLSVTTRSPAGRTHQVGYVQVPSFTERQKVVWSLHTSSQNTFPIGEYSIDFSVQNPSGTRLTHTIKIAVDDKMYRGPEQVSFVSERVSGSSTYVTVQAAISGELETCASYDSRGCFVSSTGYVTADRLVKGERSEHRCGTTLPSGSGYFFLMYAENRDTSTPIYATFDRP